ncbi:MAG: hypothetical protein IBX72_15330 [Nitrospirae bacterium]|nr:hypothetical protein [Nitrospirota bacterium]
MTSGKYVGEGLPGVVKRLGGVWDYAHDSGFIPTTFERAVEIANKIPLSVGKHIMELDVDGLYLRAFNMKDQKWNVLKNGLKKQAQKKREE